MRSRDSNGGCGASRQCVPWTCGVCRLLKEQQHLHPSVEHHLWGCRRVCLFRQEPKREESQPQCYLHSYCGGSKYVIHLHVQKYRFIKLNLWQCSCALTDKEAMCFCCYCLTVVRLICMFSIIPLSLTFCLTTTFPLSHSFSEGGWQYFDSHHCLSAGWSHWLSYHCHGDKGLGCSLPAEGRREEVSRSLTMVIGTLKANWEHVWL